MTPYRTYVQLYTMRKEHQGCIGRYTVNAVVSVGLENGISWDDIGHTEDTIRLLKQCFVVADYRVRCLEWRLLSEAQRRSGRRGCVSQYKDQQR